MLSDYSILPPAIYHQVGEYWNMLCSLNGVGPWTRFTSNDSSLMHWSCSNTTFTHGGFPGLSTPRPPLPLLRRFPEF